MMKLSDNKNDFNPDDCVESVLNSSNDTFLCRKCSTGTAV